MHAPTTLMSSSFSTHTQSLRYRKQMPPIPADAGHVVKRMLGWPLSCAAENMVMQWEILRLKHSSSGRAPTCRGVLVTSQLAPVVCVRVQVPATLHDPHDNRVEGVADERICALKQALEIPAVTVNRVPTCERSCTGAGCVPPAHHRQTVFTAVFLARMQIALQRTHHLLPSKPMKCGSPLGHTSKGGQPHICFGGGAAGA